MAKDYRYEGNDAGEFCGISKGGPLAKIQTDPFCIPRPLFFAGGCYRPSAFIFKVQLTEGQTGGLNNDRRGTSDSLLQVLCLPALAPLSVAFLAPPPPQSPIRRRDPSYRRPEDPRPGGNHEEGPHSINLNGFVFNR